ncbi:hypothetical protein, partial [Salmonella sp. s39606]|uniref:hypothetical protein n=1 Tax=Salmonella sp. s39606 TaxID=3159643 RepID=UPI0039808FA3
MVALRPEPATVIVFARRSPTSRRGGPASSSPPQTQRTPSPLTRMPAAGDALELPAARLGKHRLPADASTGDAGPPA